MLILLTFLLPSEAKKNEKVQTMVMTGGPAETPASTPAATDPAAGFDKAAALSKMQGAWYIVSSEYGERGAVVEVSGTTTHLVSTNNDVTYETEIESPCTVKWKEGTGWTESTYAFDGDQMLTGNVAQKVGDKIYACVSGGLYVIEGATCTRWEFHHAGEWSEWVTEPGACRTSDAGAVEVTANDYTYVLSPHGDAFVETDGWVPKVERVPDMKAGLDKMKAK